MEGTYQSHSPNAIAIDIWPTVATPSMGPSIQTSQRMRIRVTPKVTNARAPTIMRAPQPCRNSRSERLTRVERNQIQMPLTATLVTVATAQHAMTSSRRERPARTSAPTPPR